MSIPCHKAIPNPSETSLLPEAHLILLTASNSDTALEPRSDELSDSDWVEIDELEMDDQMLMDLSRPGRRRAARATTGVEMLKSVRSVSEESAKRSKKKKTVCFVL